MHRRIPAFMMADYTDFRKCGNFTLPRRHGRILKRESPPEKLGRRFSPRIITGVDSNFWREFFFLPETSSPDFPLDIAPTWPKHIEMN